MLTLDMLESLGRSIQVPLMVGVTKGTHFELVYANNMAIDLFGCATVEELFDSGEIIDTNVSSEMLFSPSRPIWKNLIGIQSNGARFPIQANLSLIDGYTLILIRDWSAESEKNTLDARRQETMTNQISILLDHLGRPPYRPKMAYFSLLLSVLFLIGGCVIVLGFGDPTFVSVLFMLVGAILGVIVMQIAYMFPQ